MNHIIPNDEKSHIESETCWCNPRISQSEGETYYIHNPSTIKEVDNIINVRSNKYKFRYEDIQC